MHISNFSKYSSFKSKYLTLKREPFFELAASYIPEVDSVILDIGSGEGDFYVYLRSQKNNLDQVYLLDGNELTVEKNKELTRNSIFYLAPDKLPFDDLSVDFIHLSHLMDNLTNNDLYC